MRGRVIRRLDHFISGILLGTMSIRCRRALNMKELNRVSNHALAAAIRSNMGPGEDMAERQLGRRVSMQTDSDGRRTVVTLRIQSKTSPDACFTKKAGAGISLVAACSCFEVKLVMGESDGEGAAYCSCPSPEALLCKHIWCALFLEGGAAQWGIAKDSIRLDADPDLETGGDDDDSGDQAPAPLTISSLADDVEVETPITQANAFDQHALAALVQYLDHTLSRLSLATRPAKVALCSQFVCEIRARMRDLDTTIKVPARPGQGFARIRNGRSRSPPQRTDADAAFVAARGTFMASRAIGRPAHLKPHINPLMSEPELFSRLASSSGSAVDRLPEPSSAAQSAVNRRSQSSQVSAQASTITSSAEETSSSSSSVTPPRSISKREPRQAPKSPNAADARTGAEQERDSKKPRQP
jgi:hypothetical protein